jgi:hypothetical protein
MVCVMKCIPCADTGWVCENHPRRPWEGAHARDCGAAGMPCAACKTSDVGVSPAMPDGFKTEVDNNGCRINSFQLIERFIYWTVSCTSRIGTVGIGMTSATTS